MTQKELMQLFRYNENGWLEWKIATGTRTKLNERAGAKSKDGYRKIFVNGKSCAEHRLVWFYHTGEWPVMQLDHINRIKDDNRIENLRECTSKENQQNTDLQKNNTSGFKGVGWYKKYNKWCAKIKVDGKYIFLGYFENKEDAIKVRKESEEKYWRVIAPNL